MEFSRPEYWSALSFPPTGDLPKPGIKPRSPALQADSLPAEPPGKPKNTAVGSLSLLQGTFPSQGSNPGLPHCRRTFYQMSHKGSPRARSPPKVQVLSLRLNPLDPCCLALPTPCWSPLPSSLLSVCSFVSDSHDPMDCSPPGPSVRGILQAGTLEWVAMPSSRGSSCPRNRTRISCVYCMAGGYLSAQPSGKPFQKLM